jgi:methyl-accepting chemotaxis protein
MVVVALLIGLALTAYDGFSKQKAAMDDLFMSRFRGFQDSAGVVIGVTNIQSSIYRLINWSNAGFDQQRIDQSIQEQKASIEGIIGTLKTTVALQSINEEERKLYQETLAHAERYKEMMEQVLQMVSVDATTASLLMSQADDTYQALYKSLSELMGLENKLGKDGYESSVKSSGLLVKVFVIVLVSAIALALLVSVVMARLITGPIRSAIDVVKNIAEGDLTQEILVSSKDEIGQLTQSIDSMRVKMAEAVGASVVASLALSESASEQAAAIQETSSSLEEISAQTKSTVANTNQANVLMQSTLASTVEANASMGELTVSMNEIAVASEQTKKIVKTTDEIAFQTNLLALNAAVEAARAGEAGAGFAVVADEVRNLAMRAAEAARTASSLMGDITAKVSRGDHLVKATNQVFHNVSDNCGKVVELMGEVALASREQAQGIDQINQALADMNTVTQRNAAGAEELASTMATFKIESHQTNIRRHRQADGSSLIGIPGPHGPDGSAPIHATRRGRRDMVEFEEL